MAANVKKCSKCREEIPKARLEALPETTTCVRCSCEECRRVYDVDVETAAVDDLVDMVNG